MEKVDVVIAGAGIAGCLAARNLAKAGYSVLLVERQPGEKLGHDWWDSVEMCVFDEVAMPAPDPPERMNPTGDVKIISPLETASFESGSFKFKTNIDRKLFAARQLRYAIEAGARFMDKTSVLGAIIEGGKVEGIVIRPAGGQPTEVRAKMTIDATGFSSALRRSLPEYWGFPRVTERTDSFVTYREIRINTGGRSDGMLVFGKDNGVRWIKRSQPGLVDYFAGVVNMPGRISPRAIINEMLSATDGYGDVVRGGYGAPIPVRREFDSLVMPGFVLCGDSGCQCSPIDGSGIVSSLRAAHFASKTIIDALQQNRFDETALWPYNAAYKRTQGAAFAKLDMLQKFMVGSDKNDLELLFTKGLINDNNFRQDKDAPKQSKVAMLPKLAMMLNHPKFVLRLVRTFSTIDKFEKHYKEFPEQYTRDSYLLWKEKADKLFAAAR